MYRNNVYLFPTLFTPPAKTESPDEQLVKEKESSVRSLALVRFLDIYPHNLLAWIMDNPGLDDVHISLLSGAPRRVVTATRLHIAEELLRDNYRWYTDKEIAHIVTIPVVHIQQLRKRLGAFACTTTETVHDHETLYFRIKEAALADMRRTLDEDSRKKARAAQLVCEKKRAAEPADVAERASLDAIVSKKRQCWNIGDYVPPDRLPLKKPHWRYRARRTTKTKSTPGKKNSETSPDTE